MLNNLQKSKNFHMNLTNQYDIKPPPWVGSQHKIHDAHANKLQID